MFAFFGKFKIYIAVISAVAVVGFFAGRWVINLIETNAQLEQAAVIQNNRIDGLQKANHNLIVRNNGYQTELASEQLAKQEATNILNGYRGGRLNDSALQRPEIVQSRINDATANLMRRFYESSSRP